MNSACHKLLNSPRQRARWSPCELFLFVICLYLLRRSLHHVVANRTLDTILIGIVVNHRMFAPKIVPGWRRRGTPLQRSGFPRIVRRRLAPKAAVNQVVNKNKLGSAGDQGSDSDPTMHRDQRLQVVKYECRVAADSPSYSQIMERHENAICPHEAEPEMNLAQSFVHHASAHLGKPEISSRENPEHGGDAHHHVEMSHHEIGRVKHDVDRGLSQEEPTDTAAHEHRNKAQGK